MLVRILLLVAAAAGALAQTPVFAQVDEMLASLSKITGWKVQRKVPAEMLGKDKFRKFLEDNLKEASTDKEIRAQELTLKMFGLVPQDFNLLRQTADLYAEQAAAFYDYKKKRLFLLEGTAVNDAEQRMALVHELAHALADQRHSLGKYMHRGNPDDDAATARQAVTEGQATWLTFAYLAQTAGAKAEVPAAMLDQLAGASGGGDDYPVLAKAPLYIRESLVFPYNQGLRFQDAVYRKRGQPGFDEVFQRPPVSTQQILHASAYFDQTQPASVAHLKLEDVAGKDARRLRRLIDGSLGEFDVSALLRQYGGAREGAAAASHWRGGWFELLEHKQLKFPVLVHVAQWDSPDAARAYFNMYQRVLRAKWKKMEMGAASESEVTGTGDSGRFVLRLAGDTVNAVEGLR